MIFHDYYRIIHENGYSCNERELYRSVVFSNTIQSMIAIIKALHLLDIPFGSVERIVSEWLHNASIKAVHIGRC